jgi:hypothetical protein
VYTSGVQLLRIVIIREPSAPPSRLRPLLDAGHDVEDDDGEGWTLLRHAIDAEHDGHLQSGGPLHADVTAFLLARGADPLRACNGVPVVVEAEECGHWLAADIMRAWIRRGPALVTNQVTSTPASLRPTATRPDAIATLTCTDRT